MTEADVDGFVDEIERFATARVENRVNQFESDLPVPLAQLRKHRICNYLINR
jgi:hypothetical protein